MGGHLGLIISSVSLAIMKSMVIKNSLLSLSPLEEESNQTAENHKNFMYATLEYYGIRKQLFKFFTADNCSTMQKLARITRPMIGCKSHILALAIKDYYEFHRYRMNLVF